MGNYAFIDGTNLHLTYYYLQQPLNYQKLRNYLAKRHNVTTAYYFIGLIEKRSGYYQELELYGYTMKFRRPVLHWVDPIICQRCLHVVVSGGMKRKCDCDADMAFQIIEDINNYDKAVLISSDGDFDNVVKKLITLDKFKLVLAPCKDGCSELLKSVARGRIEYLNELGSTLDKF